MKRRKKILDGISGATFNKCYKIGLKHAKENAPFIKKTILDLKSEAKSADSALVFSAGPSLHAKDPARHLGSSNYGGKIVCADGALYYCLRNGIIPDYVVSVDPHPDRIVRFFGDSKLKKAPRDDYFRRQDLDPGFNKNEIKRNKEVLDLVNKHGRKMKAIISTSVTPKITRRCLEAGMELYWWNPIYDDYADKASITRKIFNITKAPCMSTGGNVGTSAWVFANAILGAKKIALLGMDLSYAPGTPFERTQYYHELKEVFKKRIADGFIKIYNPHLNETWYTDPAYYWYRENFLKLAATVDSVTYNCTEGGILFGKGIEFLGFRKFLKRFGVKGDK